MNAHPHTSHIIARRVGIALLALFVIYYAVIVFSDEPLPFSRYTMFASQKFPICSFHIEDQDGQALELVSRQHPRVAYYASKKNMRQQDHDEMCSMLRETYALPSASVRVVQTCVDDPADVHQQPTTQTDYTCS